MTCRQDWIAALNEDIAELTWADVALVITRVEKDAEEAERAFFHVQDQRERLKKMLELYRNIQRLLERSRKEVSCSE